MSGTRRKAVNFPQCYMDRMWGRADIECLNCDLWSKCEENLRLKGKRGV